jgi:hypothetical protein
MIKITYQNTKMKANWFHVGIVGTYSLILWLSFSKIQLVAFSVDDDYNDDNDGQLQSHLGVSLASMCLSHCSLSGDMFRHYTYETCFHLKFFSFQPMKNYMVLIELVCSTSECDKIKLGEIVRLLFLIFDR